MSAELHLVSEKKIKYCFRSDDQIPIHNSPIIAIIAILILIIIIKYFGFSWKTSFREET